jgi:hypothetical protein
MLLHAKPGAVLGETVAGDVAVTETGVFVVTANTTEPPAYPMAAVLGEIEVTGTKAAWVIVALAPPAVSLNVRDWVETLAGIRMVMVVHEFAGAEAGETVAGEVAPIETVVLVVTLPVTVPPAEPTEVLWSEIEVTGTKAAWVKGTLTPPAIKCAVRAVVDGFEPASQVRVAGRFEEAPPVIASQLASVEALVAPDPENLMEPVPPVAATETELGEAELAASA